MSTSEPGPFRFPNVFIRLGCAALLAAVGSAACDRPSTSPELSGPFDHLLTLPAGHFVHVSSYDTTGGNRDRLEIPVRAPSR